MKAAIYLRVSTTSQTGADHVSLSVQEAAAHDFVTRQGGDVVLVLRDEGRSGLDADRPEYQRLFELAASGAIDTVVVYRYDRLGRDAAEFLSAAKRLTAAGCTLLSATEPNESKFVTGLLALLAEDESSRIRARTVPAMLARLRQGKWVGRAPVGYDIVAHPSGGRTLAPNAAAPHVARLFQLYATGQFSIRQLTAESRLLGLNNGHGIEYTHLSRILSNPAYCGHVVWGRKATLHDGVRRSRVRQRREWTEFPGAHPALVTEELFEAVQVMLATNRERMGPPSDSRQLLIGLVYCGQCGRRMAARPMRTGAQGQRWYSYYCKNNKDDRTCAQPSVSTRIADGQVMAYIAEHFHITQEGLEWAAGLIRAEADTYLTGAAARKRQLERAHTKLTNERTSLAMELARGVLKHDVYQAADLAYEAQIASVANELQELGAVTVPDLSAAITALASVSWSDLDREGWRDILHAVAHRVTITDKTAAVELSPDGEAYLRILESTTIGDTVN